MRKILNTAIAFSILCNLFFTQVVVSFLHNHQNTSVSELKKTKDESVKTHTELCKICSLDIIHEFFFNELPRFTFYTKTGGLYLQKEVQFTFISLILAKDRAPPVCFLLS